MLLLKVLKYKSGYFYYIFIEFVKMVGVKVF